MRLIRKIIPAPLLSAYHFCVAHLAAIRYGFPSKKLLVIAVTGTKGKSSVTEMVNAILETAGYKTIVLNSIRFKIGKHTEPNLTRMSTPGRFFIQRSLAKALKAGCTAAVLELTSEGARQHRHRAIELDALIFTNLAPEHIESHGSYEAYGNAKFEIGKQLARSKKRPRIIVANGDDSQSARYLSLPVEKRIRYSLSRLEHYEAGTRGGHIKFDGVDIAIKLPGEFSLKNALAAATLCQALDIDTETIARGIASLTRIPGRGEHIDAGQSFSVVVDYAHTPGSLQALYDSFPRSRKICILGNTGGGRDKWKRPVMGKIADESCDVVYLTNEDPYNEDPHAIVEEMATGMKRTPTIIMDRRLAIRDAISKAGPGDAVLISGKGTDPCICVEKGKKIPWSDASVAREELALLASQQELY